MKVHRGRGCVFSLCYHVVFCVKYRHRVLTGPVVQRLGKILHQQAETNGFQIPSMQVMPDHVHLLLMCRPQHTIPELLRQLKGTSVRLLFQEFPQLRGKLWGGHLWSPSYFVSTVGQQTEDAVKIYIQSQRGVGCNGDSV